MSTYMSATIGFLQWYFFKYGSTMKHIKLKKVILASVNRSITASLILEQLLHVSCLYFGRLLQHPIISFIFGHTSTILSVTHLFPTHQVAQKYNGYTFDFVTTWKSSLWAGKSCNRLNPLLKMSLMPQDVLSTPDLTVTCTEWNSKCLYQ